MNQLVAAQDWQISARFANVPVTDDLSSGIQSSFGLIGYKGKVWSIRYRGDEQQLMRDDGDGPRGSIEVVVLKASPNISKIWYEQGYVEGSNAAPDCFSNNGLTPEPTSTKKQCDTCALCPHNQWGSRITPAGKAGKSCADSKRLAVVPAGDLNNEAYGGPMLLRVPAASLQDLAMYGQKMQQMGYPYYSIATKISFDASEAYPKFLFQGLRPLADAEAEIVLGLRESHTVQRILSENEFAPKPDTQAAGAAQGEAPLFEQAPDVGARTQNQGAQNQGAQNQGTQSVGDQARAAAAAQAAAHAKAAPPEYTKANTASFGGSDTVEPVKPVQKEDPKPAKKAPAKAPETQPAETQPAETQTVALDPRVMQLILAGVPAEQAKAMVDAENAKNQQVTTQVTESPVVEHEAATTQEENSQAGVAQASDFEEGLDDMLSKLLPTL